MNRKTTRIAAIAFALTANAAQAAGENFDWYRGTGGVPPPLEAPTTDVYAQNTAAPKGTPDAVRAMDSDNDGMISKAEFLRMMEAKFDAMDKTKSGRLTPAQVQQSITEIGKTYGYNN